MQQFIKIHGAGNDFILMDGREALPSNIPETAQKLCDRRLGIGGDGLIFLKNSQIADFEMHYSNRDGTSSTCGNGIRCLARFCEEVGVWKKESDSISFDTVGGVVVVERTKLLGNYRVNMGPPRFDALEIPFLGDGEIINKELEVDGKKFNFSAVSMGNPHSVIFVEDLDSIDLEDIGPKIETLPIFPKKTNVSFVKVIDRQNVKMKVWERAVGVTLACGTANCSILAVGSKEGRLDKKISLEAPGGMFEVEWIEKGDILLTGPTEVAFSGEVQI